MHKYVPPPIKVGQSTDVGRRRHENQDSMGYAQLDRFAYKGAHLLITADGMGGASGGQQASSTAVEKILEYFQQGHPSPEPDIAIREAVELAAEAVQAKAVEDPRLEGMGTTCVVVIIHNGYLFAGHIGDSRLYMWRQGKLLRLSRDHSRVQFMVEAGIISEEDAKRHPHQNFLARVLGSNQQPRVEILAPPRKLELGDRLLLCSDGLYNEVDDEEIFEILGTYEPQKASDTLVEMANENGGNDNITVQILSYGDLQPPQVAESWFQFPNATAGFAFSLFCFVLVFLGGFFVGRYNQARSYRSNASNAQPQDHTDPCIAADGADRCGDDDDDDDDDDAGQGSLSTPDLPPNANTNRKPASKPAVRPVARSAPTPVTRPAIRPAPVPAIRPAPVPAVRPAPVPAVRPAPVPAVRPAPVPAIRPAPVPVVRPAVLPGSRPVLPTPPASRPVVRPSSKPTVR